MIVAFLVVVGLSLGSFVNAFVWRLHEKKDWVSGRSECVHCHHELASKDLIPVISWLSLKGKCRYCHKPISIQYPIIELSTAIVFLLSYYLWPVPIQGAQVAVFVLWLILLTGMMALLVYDVKWMLLPNKLVYSLTAIATSMAIIRIATSGNKLSDTINYAIATLIGGGLFFVLYNVSKGRWIGGGDVKLGFMLGLIAATAGKSFLLIFIAAILGSLVSVPMIFMGKMKKTSIIPFGPFLIASAFIVQFAGSSIVEWYMKTFITG